MAINRVQTAICESLISQANFWLFSTDLDSPSHYIDIEDSREILIEDFDVPKEVAEEYASRLMDMINFIRNV